jgi:opacity protein-like surface antigen
MNRPRVTAGLLAVVGLAVFAPGSAAAQSALGPYVAVGAGYDNMPDRNLVITGAKVSSQWKSGSGGFVAAGYKWRSGLRTEAELSGRVSKVTTFNGASPWAGKQWDTSLLLNVLYDLNTGGPITPYVGGGLGATQIQWGDNFRATAQATPIVYDAESIKLGWQAIAGVSFAVTPQVALAVDARIKGAAGAFNFPGSVAGRYINQFHYSTRSVFVSVRYSFGAGKY